MGFGVRPILCFGQSHRRWIPLSAFGGRRGRDQHLSLLPLGGVQRHLSGIHSRLRPRSDVLELLDYDASSASTTALRPAARACTTHSPATGTTGRSFPVSDACRVVLAITNRPTPTRPMSSPHVATRGPFIRCYARGGVGAGPVRSCLPCPASRTARSHRRDRRRRSWFSATELVGPHWPFAPLGVVERPRPLPAGLRAVTGDIGGGAKMSGLVDILRHAHDSMLVAIRHVVGPELNVSLDGLDQPLSRSGEGCRVSRASTRLPRTRSPP